MEQQDKNTDNNGSDPPHTKFIGIGHVKNGLKDAKNDLRRLMDKIDSLEDMLIRLENKKDYKGLKTQFIEITDGEYTRLTNWLTRVTNNPGSPDKRVFETYEIYTKWANSKPVREVEAIVYNICGVKLSLKQIDKYAKEVLNNG